MDYRSLLYIDTSMKIKGYTIMEKMNKARMILEGLADKRVDEAKQRVWYVEYDNGGEPQKAVMNSAKYNKMKKIDWIKVTKAEELKDDNAVKLAQADVAEWEKKNGEGKPF